MTLYDRLTVLAAAGGIAATFGIGTCGISSRVAELDRRIYDHMVNHQDGRDNNIERVVQLPSNLEFSTAGNIPLPTILGTMSGDARINRYARMNSYADNLSSFDMRLPLNVEYTRNEADQGDAAAQNNLGVMYAKGQGVSQNYELAAKWFRRSVDQGDAAAQNNLGVMYANGWGVSQGAGEAVFLFRRSADQGNAAAQNNLGVMYANGWGAPRDYVAAHKWLNLAGAQGYLSAVHLRNALIETMSVAQIRAAQEAARVEAARAERAGAVG